MGSYVEIPDGLDLTSTDFTIEFWAMRSAIGNQDWVLLQGSASNGQGLHVGFRDTDVFAFAFFGDDLNVSSSNFVNDTAWHHWAVTYDTPSGDRKVYQDGTLVDSDVAGGTYTGTGLLSLGWKSNLASAYFGGRLDEIRIWNVARSGAEITAAMDTPLTGEENNLVGYWPLDQGARRVIADLTTNANHGTMIDGVHWSDASAPLNVSAITDDAGNYAFSNIRYGDGTAFTVTPILGTRSFLPARKTITLSTESPVQNEVDFIDESAFTVSGRILYGTDGVCPVEGVELYIREGFNGNDDLKGDSESDGTFAIPVDPSIDNSDVRRLTPLFAPGTVAHSFTPSYFEYTATTDTAGIVFRDLRTQTLRGWYGGGGPTCNEYIGDIILTITTEDGCFTQVETLASLGNYAFDLPPQQYLVSAEVDLNTIPSYLDAADVFSYFDDLGQQFIDLTVADDTLDLVYRAPVSISITGFPETKGLPRNYFPICRGLIV